MTLCPIALVVGCRKCPIFNLCPVKGLIGDMSKKPESVQVVEVKTKPKTNKGAATKPAARKPRATVKTAATTTAKPKRVKKPV